MAVLRELIATNVVVVYMDDVITPSQDFVEGLAKLKDVLQVASRNGLRINWRKCQILHSKVQFLGYIIQSGTITPGIEKIQAVKEFPIPHDKKAIQRFLGLTSYFRKFINGYASIARQGSSPSRSSLGFIFAGLQLQDRISFGDPNETC